MANTKSNPALFVYNRSLPDFVYSRSLPVFFFCLYQVTSTILVYTRSLLDLFIEGRCFPNHTSVCGAASAWAGEHSCRAVATALARWLPCIASPG